MSDQEIESDYKMKHALCDVVTPSGKISMSAEDIKSRLNDDIIKVCGERRQFVVLITGDDGKCTFMTNTETEAEMFNLYKMMKSIIHGMEGK